MFKRKAVFLDRDGTLIDIIHRPDFKKKHTAPFTYDELRFVPKVKEVLEFLKDKGFMRIMITNQPDVANGYMTESEWHRIHCEVLDTLRPDDFYMCRHTSDANCLFKKPSYFMLLAAADKWGIDLSQSYMVGDTSADMDAGKAAGCKTVLIRTSYNADTQGDFEITKLTDLFELFKDAKNVAVMVQRENIQSHACGFCPASFSTTEDLYVHQRNVHDLDEIMFSEIGLPK